MATRQDIQAIIIYMQGLFPNYRPNLDGDFNAIDAMLDVLGDLDTKTLRLAVKAACMPGTGRQFAPSADEIRSAMVGLQIRASGVPQPGEAWEEVISTIHRIGCHGPTPEFSHPLVRKAVQAIGLQSIGMSEDLMVERAHFLKIYGQYLERATEDAAMIPEAVQYIETRKQIGAGIKMLADRLAK
jgi:hypothetical protein